MSDEIVYYWKPDGTIDRNRTHDGIVRSVVLKFDMIDRTDGTLANAAEAKAVQADHARSIPKPRRRRPVRPAAETGASQ